jgi:phosphatidate cytidylyltransferase
MKSELNKRIFTSLGLCLLAYLMLSYTYILIISLIIISMVSWIEFLGLISKIFNKNKTKTNLLKSFFKTLSLIYLIIFSVLIFIAISEPGTQNKIKIIYLFSICIASDIGGLIFGKTFKGKKLTKISPNKTIAGAIGSFISSLVVIPFFYYYGGFSDGVLGIVALTIILSFSCQSGDLFISYLKRNAKVKNTGDLLPGHGGFLDRIDGILFAVPIGILLSGPLGL